MSFKIQRTSTGDWGLSADVPNQLVFRPNGSIIVPHQQDVDINTGKAIATVDMLPKSVGAMFEITQWMGAPDKLPRGKFALNGQHVSELLVPGLQDAIRETGQPFVTADEWRADAPTNCGKFGLADGYTILPDWSGEQGGLGKLYFAGAPETLRGSVVGDAIRDIVGYIGGSHASMVGDASGAFTPRTAQNWRSVIEASFGFLGADFNASNVVPTAEENRPKTVYGTWTIQLYGNFTGPLEADPAALVSIVTGVDTRLNNLEAATDFVMLYPLGTRETPHVMGGSQRLVINNPFPGYHVLCLAEIRWTDGNWGETNWHFDGVNARSYGVKATLYGTNAETIVVQSGHFVLGGAVPGGSPQPNNVAITTAPVRLKVWKLRGVE